MIPWWVRSPPRGTNEQSHEIMVLFVLRILQMRMRSHPVGLDVWFLVGPFVYFHTLSVWTAKPLVRLRWCAGSPKPSLVAYVIIHNFMSWLKYLHVYEAQHNLCEGLRARTPVQVPGCLFQNRASVVLYCLSPRRWALWSTPGSESITDPQCTIDLKNLR